MYFAERTTEDATIYEFETAFPTNVSMITRRKSPVFAVFTTNEASCCHVINKRLYIKTKNKSFEGIYDFWKYT